MSGFNIDTFIGKLANGGARANLFEVTVTNARGSLPDFTFMCREIPLPGHEVGNIEVTYFGQKYNVPGDRRFGGTIDLVVLLDEGLEIRRGFEDWINKIRYYNDNKANTNSVQDFYCTVSIQTFRKDGSNDTMVELSHAWPTKFGDVQLSWDEATAVMMLPVTLQYTYHDTK